MMHEGVEPVVPGYMWWRENDEQACSKDVKSQLTRGGSGVDVCCMRRFCIVDTYTIMSNNGCVCAYRTTEGRV